MTNVVAILEMLKNLDEGPDKERTDIEPTCLDLKINISDVTRGLDAFKGNLYYGSVGMMPNPCSSTCGLPFVSPHRQLESPTLLSGVCRTAQRNPYDRLSCHSRERWKACSTRFS